MSVEENKAIVRRWFKELSSGNVDVADEVGGPELVFHTPSGADLHGIEGFKQVPRGVLGYIPDARFDVDDLIAEGDKVVARWTLSGTHTGQWRDIAPTGNKVSTWLVSVFRFAGGKIVEVWVRSDTYGWRQQLGMIPPIGGGEE
jgi:predicted ester cyclase